MKLLEPDALEATKLLAFEAYNFRVLVKVYRNGHMLRRGLWTILTSQTLLLHTRVVWDFFYTKPKREDIGLEHFIGLIYQGEPFNFPRHLIAPPADLPTYRVKRAGIKSALDKRLVHFGRGRFEHDEHGQKQVPAALEDYDQHFDELEERILAFRRGLPGPLQKEFDHRIRQFGNRDRLIVTPIEAPPKLGW